MKCPDCKIEMELVIPDDNENYYKCPRCSMEEPVDDSGWDGTEANKENL